MTIKWINVPDNGRNTAPENIKFENKMGIVHCLSSCRIWQWITLEYSSCFISLTHFRNFHLEIPFINNLTILDMKGINNSYLLFHDSDIAYHKFKNSINSTGIYSNLELRVLSHRNKS